MKKFAFLIHLRDTSDISRRIFPAKLLPSNCIEGIIKRLGGRLGYTICSHFHVLERAEGYIIGVYLTGNQMVTLPLKEVRQRIFDAVFFAQEKLNVELVGLGGLTASVTKGGRWLVQEPRIHVKITHGDTYAVAVAEDSIERVINLCGVERRKIKIAIVGAYGLIGGG